MAESIDRSVTCPTLMRCFWSDGEHNPLQRYRSIANVVEMNEVDIFVWQDSSFAEIVAQLRERIPGASGRNVHLSLKLVLIDRGGQFQTKNVSMKRLICTT